MNGIVKTFPGVRALDGVSFDVRAGEVHALVGENGAGKSTLMKVLAGAYRADAGSVEIDGTAVVVDGPRAAEALGIGMIYQEFNLVPDLRVVDNILLGHEPVRGAFLDGKAALERAAGVLAELGIILPLAAPARRLTVAQQQMTEIAKALVRKARLIVMDEPTAALTEREIDALFALITKLKAQGVAFVYISHRLEELPRISDRITVIRDGKTIATHATRELPQEEMIRLMVGRPVDAHFPELPPVAPDAPVVLRVNGLRAAGGVAVDGVSFEVRAGEIVGLAGLVGAGRTDIVRAIAGADVPTAGEIDVAGRRVAVRGPHDAIAAGIALITEDRKGQGLVLGMSVRENTTLAHLEDYAPRGFIDRKAESGITSEEIAELRIRTPNGEQTVRNLSGGNQQKVLVARWLMTHPRILILDEPTRGIDVGAKAEIHRLISELAAKGVAVLMISSELPEVLGMSDRILVMHEGRMTGIVDRQDATQVKIMELASQ